MNLDDLLEDLTGLTDQQIEAHGRQLYNSIYITSGNRGIHHAHDGEEVYFFKDSFDHAFKQASEWRQYVHRKDKIDAERVKRVRWIAPVLSGHVEWFECWEEYEGDIPKSRFYIIRGKSYLVWLIPRSDKGWKFKTAYTPTFGQLRRITDAAKRIYPPKKVKPRD